MDIGRTLIAFGLVLVVAGLLFSFGGRLLVRLGHVPGDIHIQGKNSSFYFPITTCILLSVLLSLTGFPIPACVGAFEKGGGATDRVDPSTLAKWEQGKSLLRSSRGG